MGPESRIKYPRTYNLPWSNSDSSDDVWWKDCKIFEGKEVIVTEKQDGESTTIYSDGFVHARSLDTAHHPSRSWIKKFAATFAHHIPKGMRICGENVYAWHSIFYTELPTYFFVYGIYDRNNFCISWDDVEEICELLGLQTVPIIYRGIWDEELVKNLWTGKGLFPTFSAITEYPNFPQDFINCDAEGYVVRLTDSFEYSNFKHSCAKMVRKNHVTTSTNWLMRKVIPNLLAETLQP